MSTKIPRLRNGPDKEARVARKSPPQKKPIRTLAGKNEKKVDKPEVKTFVRQVPDKSKKSPLREVNVNKFRTQPVKENHSTKATLYDRRGISEIKRSEQNLRTKVESMEHDMQSMKHELGEVRHEVEKKTKEIEDMKNKESSLKDQMDKLEKENEIHSITLEKMGFDPVRRKEIEPSDLLDSLVASSGQKQENFAAELRSSLSELESSLDSVLTQLDQNSEIVE